MVSRTSSLTDDPLFSFWFLPDMINLNNDDPEKKVEGDELKTEEGIDTRFNDRFQKRMDALKRAVSLFARVISQLCLHVYPHDASFAISLRLLRSALAS